MDHKISVDTPVPPFEGPEKLLELWFAPDMKWLRQHKLKGSAVYGLRTISRAIWDEVLGLVKCKVINVISNDVVDAFLLSESSLFVWNDRLVLKTCGTTTTLYAIPRILEEAKKVGMVHVDNVFYSRKRFLYPDRQLPIHTNFANEVEFLDDLFDDGSAYSLGTLNDSWNLYITEHKTYSESESEDDSSDGSSSEVFLRDQTLEILMHDLDPDAMLPFWKNAEAGFATSEDATEKSGISGFFPGAQLDAFLFEPCGYSLNGLIRNKTTAATGGGKSESKVREGENKGEYFTIHITPQESCSYVSFETNVELDNYDAIIADVLKVFRPGRYIISFFSNEGLSAIQKRVTWDSPKVGYVQGAKTYYNFEEYSLMFVQAKKKDKVVRGKSSNSSTKVKKHNHKHHVTVKDSPLLSPALRPRTPG